MMLQDPAILQTRAFIGGSFVSATGGATFAVVNPATGERISDVADCPAADALHAVASAETAFRSWRGLLAKERAACLRRLYDLMLSHQEDLARLMTAEQGKPLAEARAEVAYAAGFFEWFGEEAKRLYGEVIPANAHGRRLLVLKQPVGVATAITPWNFPLAMIARKAAPALAAGCTFVVKPAAETPLSALALAELGCRAGLPAGVLNVVPGTGAAEIGEILTTDPRVRKFSFTGSTPVGKMLAGQCAGTVKKVSLELGGNAPFIVFDDADLDQAVAGAVASKFRNMGQTCVCANRFYIQDGIHEAFAARLAKAASDLLVGDGAAPGTAQGPLVSDRAVGKVEALVADALDNGATLVTGGSRHPAGRRFYQPTVLTGMTMAMRAAREEIFGPVATLFRFRDQREAIALANATPFGLAAYVYTRDLGRAWQVAEALEAGMVGVNEGVISTEVAPFGGVKESGLGREGGRAGIEDYVETKYVAMGGLGS
ncbi:MAG: NAD-dependent succinate-semialdehyde dehydrogenase [Alphaproteobacteria bacterium]|nr:NAD-dependent succinate-semialdehyde dehydrogenase [Alphaproteobacteria bacterium]